MMMINVPKYKHEKIKDNFSIPQKKILQIEVTFNFVQIKIYDSELN